MCIRDSLDGARRLFSAPHLPRRGRDLGRLFLSLRLVGAQAETLVTEYVRHAGLSLDAQDFLFRCVEDYERRKRGQNAVRKRPLR